jgi:hypothetical protein
VDSPDAVKLPLKLAVAILKDANGVIDLDLPVSGDLNDPEFRYGPIIWKAIVNLLTRIVTSPFRALGALFGGEEDLLNTVNFEAGKDNVPPPEQEKLARLLEALRQRPQLKLAVTGRYNSASDGQAIRQLQARRAVAEATGMQLEPGEDPGPVDFGSYQSQEKLKEIFIARYGQVDPSELKELGDRRANAISAYMTGPGGLSPDRVAVRPCEDAKDDEIQASLDLDAMD